MENIAIGSTVVMKEGGNAQTLDYRYTKVSNARTAGFIASYEKAEEQESFDSVMSSFNPVQQSDDVVFISKEDRFGFFDLIDMINPLHHVPLLNIAYQKLTGDTIKPISRIVGGTVFGGPIGAASGLVTTMLEEGTGKSALENVTSIARGNNEDVKAYNDLPPALLSFAEVPSVNNQNYSYNT